MGANLPLPSFVPTAGAMPTAPAAPAAPMAPLAPMMPTAPSAPMAPGFAQTTSSFLSSSAPRVTTPTAVAPNRVNALTVSQNGPVLPTQGPALIGAISRGYTAGTMAAVGSATAIAANTSATMAKNVARAIGDAGEPLLHLSWDLVGNIANFVGHVLTLNVGSAVQDVGAIFKDGAVDTGAIFKRAAEPLSLSSAVSGGSRLNPATAIGAGLSIGLKALKSSFIWAIPSAAINAFIDYKYKDVNDPKRVASNFVADVVGYTGAGAAGAMAGAAIGSMTMPIIGTIAGAGIGILLGMLHEKTTRLLISDAIRDSLG